MQDYGIFHGDLVKIVCGSKERATEMLDDYPGHTMAPVQLSNHKWIKVEEQGALIRAAKTTEIESESITANTPKDNTGKRLSALAHGGYNQARSLISTICALHAIFLSVQYSLSLVGVVKNNSQLPAIKYGLMKLQELERIQEAIRTLESCEERNTDSFRIVINSLKQKELSLQKQLESHQ